MMKQGAVAAIIWWLLAIATTAAQFRARPYDAQAVHRTAEEMLQLIDDLTNGRVQFADESGLGGMAQFIVESLASIDGSDTIDPLALDALAAVSGNGFPAWTLTSLGNRAVPALVKSASTVEGLREHRKGAMDAMEQMLERPDIERSLTAESKAAIRQLAQRALSDRTLKDNEVGAAGYLAIATGDFTLREAAAHLVQPEELQRRGLDPVADRYFVDWTIQVIRQALQKFPQK